MMFFFLAMTPGSKFSVQLLFVTRIKLLFNAFVLSKVLELIKNKSFPVVVYPDASITFLVIFQGVR